MKKRLLGLFLSALLLASALAVPASAARIPFRDVPEDHYAYYDIVYVYEKGLMDGTSDTTFSPDTPFSRAMFVTMLGRMEGIDLTRYTGAPFRDVPAGNWAAPYVQWAAENGIVNGTSEGRFSPSVTITNEQFATIVCRYMDATGRDFPSVPNWQPEISDFEAVSLWARPAVINLARYGVMDLSPDWQFFPRRDMDRVDIARYFTRLDALLSDGLLSAVDDPATRSEQTGETILSSLRAAGAYTWNWFVINAYTDPTDTVTAFYQPYNTDLTYERVLHPYVSSIQELTELGYRFYVSDQVQQFSELKQLLEYNGDLYLARPDGLGDIPYDGIHLDLMQTGEASYEITVGYYIGTQLMDTQTLQYLYDRSAGRWVFSDTVSVLFCWLDNISLSWG